MGEGDKTDTKKKRPGYKQIVRTQKNSNKAKRGAQMFSWKSEKKANK